MGLVLAFALVTATPASERIGVFQLSMVGVDAALQTTAIDALATAVAALPGRTVVSRTEIEAMIGLERLKDTIGCNDVSCMAELGMAAGVRQLIGGSISKVDDALLVTLQLIDTQRAAVEKRTTLRWQGPTSSLGDLLGLGAEELLLEGAERRPGALLVQGMPKDAIVSLDGKAPALDGSFAEVPAGIHALHLESDDYLPYDGYVIVRSGAIARTTLALVSRPLTPLYARWWFWTAAAAVVGGAAVSAVVLTREGDPARGSGTFTIQTPGTLSLVGGAP